MLQRGDDRVLHGILGGVDVAREADEGGQNPATLTPNGFRQRQVVERGFAAQAGQPAWEKSITGRTSTLPYQAPGIWAAHFRASSRSAQSSR